MSTEKFTEALHLTHSFNPNVSSKERLEAERYLMELKECPGGLNLSFHIISNEPVNEVRCFWAFNTIIHHLPSLATTVDDAQAEELYRTLFSFLYHYFLTPGAAPADYLVNKHAQMMVVGLQSFYPPRWSLFFEDLFALQARNASLQRSMSDVATVYFLRVFEYIDERVVSVRDRVDRCREQRVRDMALKDAMRGAIIPRLVSTWYALLTESRVRAPEIANLCLSVVQTYIEWIDVNLIMTADWINLLYFLITVPTLRIAAVDCLLSLVEKKQLPGLKMASLQTLNLVVSLPRITAMLIIPPNSDDEVVFTEAVAKLVVAVAEQLLALLDTCTNLREEKQRHGTVETPTAVCSVGADGVTVQDLPLAPTAQLLTDLSEAIHAVVSQLLPLLQVPVFQVRDALLPFVISYVKSATILREEAVVTLFTIFHLTRVERLAVEEDRVWDDAVIDQRKLLYNLVRLLYRRYADVVTAHLRALVHGITEGALREADRQELLNLAPSCSGVRELLAANPTDFRQPDTAEAVLRYSYEVGEVCKLETVLKDLADPITSIITELLLGDTILQHTNSCVHLAYFELLDRYYLFFVNHREYIPVLLQRILLLPCGVTNRNERVRARICYLFNHLLQVLKFCLAPYALDMATALQTIVDTTPDLVPSDRRQLYESMGTLLTVALDSCGVAGTLEEADPLVLLVQRVIQSAQNNLHNASRPPATSRTMGDAVADSISYLSTLAKGLSSSSGSSTDCTSNGSSSSTGRVVGQAEGCSVLAPSALLVAQLFQSVTEQVMQSTGTCQESLTVRDATGQYMQQMINTMPTELLDPYVERYIAAALQCMESVPELSRLLRLMYQYVNKVGRKGAPSVARTIPSLWEKIMAVGDLGPSSPVVHMGVVSENARERVDVFRQFFTFLFGIAAWGCAAAILMIPTEYASSILDQLLYAIALPAEVELPKAALQTLTKLTIELGTPAPAAEAPLSLGHELAQWHSYLLREAFPAIFRTILSPQFDLSDAKVFLLLGEVGQWCKACVTCLGEEALKAMYEELRPYVGSTQAMDFCVVVRDQPRFSSQLKTQFRGMLSHAHSSIAASQRRVTF